MILPDLSDEVNNVITEFPRYTTENQPSEWNVVSLSFKQELNGNGRMLQQMFEGLLVKAPVSPLFIRCYGITDPPNPFLIRIIQTGVFLWLSFLYFLVSVMKAIVVVQ